MSKRKLKETRTEDPVIEAVESIVKTKKNDINKANTVTFTDLFNVKKHSNTMIENNKNILEIFPDLDLVKEILVSSILSPNDMLSTNLAYKFDKINLPVDVIMLATESIKDHVTTEYEMLDKLSEIIEESLFTKGAYTELIVPDSFIKNNKNSIIAGLEHYVDDLSKINQTSILNKPLDLVRSKENNNTEILLTATDNVSIILAEEEYKEYIKQSTISAITGMSTGYEGYLTVKKALTEQEEITSIIDGGNNIGIPLIKKIDPVTVIPISSKANPSEHFGYFVILDENGNPLNGNGAYDLDWKNITSNESISNRILKRANKLLRDTTSKAPTIKNINLLREELVTKKLEEVINKSKLQGVVSISMEDRDEIIDIIFNRLLNGKKTKILFVPESLLTYYAINFRENGTGKSLLEKIAILASFRAIIVFVSLLSYIKASIPTTNVNATLDENDPDYEKTMEKIMNEVLKNRQVSLPIGILKADDLADWVHKVGFSFNFKHPGLPDVELDINEQTLDIHQPDDEFKQQIDKHIVMALGTTPELVDNAYSPDFAATIKNNNTLFSRRINKHQIAYNKVITRSVKKYMLVDGSLRNKLYEIITPNVKDIKNYIKKNGHKQNTDYNIIENMDDNTFIEYIYRTLIDSIKISLPKPELKEDDNIGDALDKYTDSIDKILDLLFSTDALPSELVGELGDKTDNIKNTIKTILVKRWLSENGYMDTIGNMFNLGEDGKPGLNVLEEYETYVEAVEKTILPFIKAMKKKADKIDNKLSKIDNDDEDNDNTDEDNNDDNKTDSSGNDNTNNDNTDSNGNDDTDSSGNTSNNDDIPEEPEL